MHINTPPSLDYLFSQLLFFWHSPFVWHRKKTKKWGKLSNKDEEKDQILKVREITCPI
jgi:hypothetical protein